MPRVPTADGFGVMPQQFQPVQAQAARPAIDPGAQLQASGQAMSRAGGAIVDLQLKALEHANQLRVDDAVNRMLEEEMRLAYDPDAGLMAQKGLAAFERPSGKTLSDEYGEAYEATVEKIASGLGNDHQRRLFSAHAQHRMLAFRESAMRHEAAEYKTYQMSVREGTIQTRMNLIGRDWANPAAMEEHAQSIRAAAFDAAQMQGKSAAWAEAQANRALSGAYKTAITSALVAGDPLGASAMLERLAPQMEADDMLPLQQAITREVDMAVGIEVGQEYGSEAAAAVAPTDRARLMRALVGQESGDRHFKPDGSLVTSDAGAIGRFQIMEGTGPEAAKLAGLKWDPELFRRKRTGDPVKDKEAEDYNRALGEAYFGEQLRVFGGDPLKALAAYNGGPGRLRQAIAKAKAEGDAAGWLKHMPPETRDYVPSVLARYGKSASTGAAPADIYERIKSDPRVAGNPARMKAAMAQADEMQKRAASAMKEAQEKVLSDVYHALYETGGRLDLVPPEVRMAIPGDKLPGVEAFADRMRKREATHDPKAWATILSLPKAELAKLSPLDFYERFAPVLDAAHLEKGYALLKDAQGEVGADAKHLEIISTADRVKRAAIDAKIIPADGDASDEQLAALAQFQLDVDHRVRQFESQDLGGKRKANSQELQVILDSVTKDVVYKPQWWWYRDSTALRKDLSPEDEGRAYVMVGDRSVRLVDIEAADRARITRDIQLRGQPVTEQAVAAMWLEVKDIPPGERAKIEAKLIERKRPVTESAVLKLWRAAGSPSDSVSVGSDLANNIPR